MSDDLRKDRPPKRRSEVSKNAADAEDMLLPGSLKAALLRELSPTRSQRERTQSAILASIGGAGASSPAVDRAHAEMAARAEQVHVASVAGGASLATKVVVSSLVLVSAAVLTTTSLRRNEPPAVARAPVAAAREPSNSRAANVPSTPGVAQPTATPGAAPAEQIHPKLDMDSRATNAPSAAVLQPPRNAGHERPRRARVPVSPPNAAPVPIVSAERSAAEDDTAATARNEPTAPVTPAVEPAPTLAGEIALVRGASDALDRQDAKSALALLTRYRRTYPAGSLAIEVQALHTIALCLDKQPGAADARDAFLREHGKSALAGRVRSGCK